MEVIETADKYVDMLKGCRENPSPFFVVDGEKIIKNWSDVLKEHAFSKPYAKNEKFKIQSYDHFVYNVDGTINVTFSEDHLKHQTFKVWKVNFIISLCEQQISNICKVGLTEEKLKDLKSLLKFLTIHAQKLYDDSYAKGWQKLK